MAFQNLLTTGDITEIFAEEIESKRGSITETFDDGTRLFIRSTLPGEREVQRGDRVRGGVALRATEREISVHPYIFRLVCQNGAIRAQTIQSWHIDMHESPLSLDFTLREAVRACCSEEALTAGTDEMRSALEQEVDLAIAMMPILSRMGGKAGMELLKSIMGRFEQERDRSAFGLMNAVTSVARDTRDPEMRWRLEELGGSVPVLTPMPKPVLDDAETEMLVEAQAHRWDRIDAGNLQKLYP